MPTLRRTITIPQVDNVSLMIRKYLDLHMPWCSNVFLQVDGGIPKCGSRFGSCLLQSGDQLIFTFSNTHPLSSAARGRLNQDWVANLIGNADRFGVVLDQSITTWNDWNARCSRKISRLVLVAKLVHRLRARANKVDFAITTNFVEARILRKKAVAWMDCFCTANFCRADDAINFQVAFGGLSRPNTKRLIRKIEIRTTAISLTENSYGLDAHLFTGTDDSKSNFASIGDQNSVVQRTFSKKDK